MRLATCARHHWPQGPGTKHTTTFDAPLCFRDGCTTPHGRVPFLPRAPTHTTCMAACTAARLGLPGTGKNTCSATHMHAHTQGCGVVGRHATPVCVCQSDVRVKSAHHWPALVPPPQHRSAQCCTAVRASPRPMAATWRSSLQCSAPHRHCVNCALEFRTAGLEPVYLANDMVLHSISFGAAPWGIVCHLIVMPASSHKTGHRPSHSHSLAALAPSYGRFGGDYKSG